jgi:hypothetical protein
MEMLARVVGNMIQDIIPDADNAFEAIDRYSSSLYKRIKLKDQANIDYTDDLELYLFLNGYKSKIAEIVHKQTLKERDKHG